MSHFSLYCQASHGVRFAPLARVYAVRPASALSPEGALPAPPRRRVVASCVAAIGFGGCDIDLALALRVPSPRRAPSSGRPRAPPAPPPRAAAFGTWSPQRHCVAPGAVVRPRGLCAARSVRPRFCPPLHFRPVSGTSLRRSGGVCPARRVPAAPAVVRSPCAPVARASASASSRPACSPARRAHALCRSAFFGGAEASAGARPLCWFLDCIRSGDRPLRLFRLAFPSTHDE